MLLRHVRSKTWTRDHEGMEESREMREQATDQSHPHEYAILSRACADLYEEMAEVLSGWPEIEVVVDRRKGRADVPAFLASRIAGADRAQAKEGSAGRSG
jgi:hypothetical protein